MNLSIFQQTKPVSGTHQLVMAISKKSAPAVILHFFPLPTPYTGQTQLHTFAGIDNVVWYYQLFESPDGSATGTVRNYFDIQPNQNAYATRSDLYLVASISDFIVSGGSGYGPDPSLIGWNWRLERVGQGTQRPNVKYIKTKAGVDTFIDDIDADGWRLAVEGDLIGENEEWVIHFQPQLVASSTSSSPSSPFSAINILTANTVLDSSAINQCFWLMGGGGYFDVQLPDLNTVADNEPVYFKSNGGSHVNVGIKAFSGQQLQWFANQSDLLSNTYASRLILGQIEEVAFCRVTLPDSSKRWLPLSPLEGAKAVGEIVSSYSRIGHNYLFLDGAQGLSRTTYSRLWEWISRLDPACVVSLAAWGTTTIIDGQTYNVNHGKFNSGDGATTFGLPKIWETGFLRAKSGAAGVGFDGMAGDFNALQLLHHKHDGFAGLIAGAPNGKGPSKSGGRYGGSQVLETDLSSLPYSVAAPNTTGAQLVRLGVENRPDSYGVFMSIKI